MYQYPKNFLSVSAFSLPLTAVIRSAVLFDTTLIAMRTSDSSLSRSLLLRHPVPDLHLVVIMFDTVLSERLYCPSESERTSGPVLRTAVLKKFFLTKK